MADRPAEGERQRPCQGFKPCKSATYQRCWCKYRSIPVTRMFTGGTGEERAAASRQQVYKLPGQRCELRRAEPARRRPALRLGFDACCLLFAARVLVGPSHQPRPSVNVEILGSAVGADERTHPRSHAAVLLHALERMLTAITRTFSAASLIFLRESARRDVKTGRGGRSVCAGHRSPMQE